MNSIVSIYFCTYQWGLLSIKATIPAAGSSGLTRNYAQSYHLVLWTSSIALFASCKCSHSWLSYRFVVIFLSLSTSWRNPSFCIFSPYLPLTIQWYSNWWFAGLRTCKTTSESRAWIRIHPRSHLWSLIHALRMRSSSDCLLGDVPCDIFNIDILTITIRSHH